MIKKIVLLFGGLFFAKLVIAEGNTQFQKFENQYNIGYGYSQGTLINGAHNQATYSNQSLNLELERLFDKGIWFDINFNMLTAYSQPDLGRLNGGSSSIPDPRTRSGAAFGQYPFYFSLTGKVGYAFNLVDNTLQFIPYGMFGRNTNWATSTIVANGGENITQDFFWTGGAGARLVYRLNDVVLLYADQIAAYNWDNSGAIKSIQTDPALYGKSYAATNYTFTSLIGARFNIYKNLQLGANAFWNDFQPQSNISGLMYTPTNTFGGEVSVGLTY